MLQQVTSSSRATLCFRIRASLILRFAMPGSTMFRTCRIRCCSFCLEVRYCEVDSELNDFAWNHFASTPPGWLRVQAICDFVHRHIVFDYMKARPDRTARDTFREGVGVCRDFMHLAITFCRCMNIPARYATGYLGDIGVPPAPFPMDFSAWFEAYLGGTVVRLRSAPQQTTDRASAEWRADATQQTWRSRRRSGKNHLASFKVWTDEVSSGR